MSTQNLKLEEQSLEKVLSRFIIHNGDKMKLGRVTLAPVIERYLFKKLQPLYERGKYDEFSLNEYDLDSKIVTLLKLLSESTDKGGEYRLLNHPWEIALSEYRGYMILYTDNAENINGIDINNSEDAVAKILICDCSFPPEITIPGINAVLEFPSTNIIRYDNPYLRKCFFSIYDMANTVLWLIEIIRPTKIISINSNSMKSHLFETIASSYFISFEHMNYE